MVQTIFKKMGLAFTSTLLIASVLSGMVATSVAFLAQTAQAATINVSYLTLAPGSNETELTFSWHTANRATGPVVRIWETGYENTAVEFTGTASSSTSTLSAMYYNRVTVNGLKANTAYTYQLGDGDGNWSGEYTTKTGNSDVFSFLVFGDPQVSSQTYGNNWKNTLELALALRPDLVFMASTGDQIDSATKAQYDYFFTPGDIFSLLPMASAVGNHESNTTSPLFFNPPNADSQNNYWYRYGDTLFLVWNSTNGNANDMRNFLTNAIAQNEDATWRILNFHYDVYGQGSSHALSDGKTYRDTYVPVIDEFNIDVVFNGHDHFYSRSYPMIHSGSSSTSNNQGMQPETFNENGASVDPTGTVYFSLSSSSGQKYYSAAAKQPYTAFMPASQSNRPQFSIVDMTANTFTCTTYQIETNNSLTLIDTYTIVKTSTVEPEVPAELILSTSKNIVKPGEYFNVSVCFPENMNSNVITLDFSFDSSKFDFANYTPADGVTLIAREYGEGYASVMLMVYDYEMENLGELMLKAKSDVAISSSVIAVVGQFVTIDENNEKVTKDASGSYIQMTSNVGTDGFVVDLITVSNLIDAFGMTSDHVDWPFYCHFDFNGNGMIDIFDISTLAQMIK